MDIEKATIDNVISLLEECLMNGKYGDSHLHAWYRGERSSIKKIKIELEEEVAMGDLADSLEDTQYLSNPLIA